MKFMLIYFFGPDGTGKTTHAELTSLYLKRKGYRAWRASVKQHHTLSYLFLRLLSLGNPQRRATNYYGFNNELKRRIKTPWKILELTSLLPAVIYRVFLPLLLGYIVVCDRYVLDTLVALSFFLKDQKLLVGASAKLLVELMPKKTLLIHLDADTDVILQRKKDEPLTERLIEFYKKGYSDILKEFRLATTYLDTSFSTTEDVQETLQHLISTCGISR